MRIIGQLKAVKLLRFENIDYNRFHRVFINTEVAHLHLKNNTKNRTFKLYWRAYLFWWQMRNPLGLW